jgi:AcrR family transcriptional regulator
MARRGDHSREEIRDMALDAAEAIVIAEGYSGLSARKVASAIGYTVGTLYLVFKNLNDLVLRVNGRTLDQLYERLEQCLPEGSRENPEQALTTLAHAYIGYAQAESPRWNMLFEYVSSATPAIHGGVSETRRKGKPEASSEPYRGIPGLQAGVTQYSAEHGADADGAQGNNAPEWYQHKLGRVFGLVETALRPLACDEAETCRIARVLWAGVHGICTLKIRQRMNLAGGQSAEEMASMLIGNFLRGALQG